MRRCLVALAFALAACGRHDFGSADAGIQPDGSVDAQADADPTNPNPRTVRISGSGSHACAIDDRGDLWCWGAGEWGQLGGVAVAARNPTRVNLPVAVAEAFSGEFGTCAIDVNRDLHCWGQQVPSLTAGPSLTEVPLPGPVRTAAVSQHARCALLQDESLWCWGENSCSQVGAAGGVDQTVPYMALPPGSGATELTMHDQLTCVLVGGVPVCFGASYDCLTPNPTPTDRPLPGGRVATEISGGCHRHLCAVATDGTVWCLGDNTYRQLGNGVTTDSATWVQAAGFGAARPARHVSVGANHTCARTDGDVWCWGNNANLECGQPVGVAVVSPAVAVPALRGVEVSQMSSGCSFNCLLTDGHVQCFGDNTRLALGDGTGADSDVPVTARVGLDR